MEYTAVAIKQHRDQEIKTFKSFDEVINYLSNGLDQWVISVDIRKWSKDNRLLSELHVCMGNLASVLTMKRM